MAEAVSIVLKVATGVYNKICQAKVNREEVASLALRVNLLIGCLTSSDGARFQYGGNKGQ